MSFGVIFFLLNLFKLNSFCVKVDGFSYSGLLYCLLVELGFGKFLNIFFLFLRFLLSIFLELFEVVLLLVDVIFFSLSDGLGL